MDEPRLWVVSLHARSAVRFELGEFVALNPSGIPAVKRIRVRNQIHQDQDGSEFAGELVVEALGEFRTADEAARSIAPAIAPLFDVAAVAANAAVDDSADVAIFAPPLDGRKGEYRLQKTSEPLTPPANVRNLSAAEFLEFVKALSAHPQKALVSRALAHYRIAIDALDGRNWLIPCEHLFIATQALGEAILPRLLVENGLDPLAKDSKAALAARLGYSPTAGDRAAHLKALDGWIRLTQVFGDDRACYQGLKKASDALEHGYGNFAEMREWTTGVADRAFARVRQCILRELNIRPDSSLCGSRFQHVLGTWPPALELNGFYTDAVSVDLTELQRGNDKHWPRFAGPHWFPVVNRIRDDANGARMVVVQFHGSGKSLIASQELEPGETNWLYPGAIDGTAAGTPLELKPSRPDAGGVGYRGFLRNPA